MIQRVKTAAIFLTLFAGVSLAQENPITKNFTLFKNLAPGVDFYATAQSDIEPLVKPIADSRKELGGFLGTDLASGAVFVCSKLAQKDAVYDQRIMRLGYKWYLVQLTAEAQREERQARMQNMAAQAGQSDQGSRGGRSGQDQSGRGGQRGGQDPAGQRGAQGPGGQSQESRMAAQEARTATTLASQAGYATLMTTLNPDMPFRISRLDDMSKSPLVDWLDIGLIARATKTWTGNLRFLQDHLEEAFDLDDILTMNRPFVAAQGPTQGGAGGGGGNPGMGGGGRGGGNIGNAGGGGGRGGATAVLPKDVQDRTLFDAQAATFLTYMIEKAGLDKTTDVVRQNMQGKDTLAIVEKHFGKNIGQIEADWQTWIKTQKPTDSARNNVPEK